MNQSRIAVIGCGNIGAALIRGIAPRSQKPQNIVACDPNEEKSEELSQEFGILSISDPLKAVEGADIVVLAVKPKLVASVIQSILPALEKNSKKALLISVAAGVTLKAIKHVAGSAFSLVRVMPNLPMSAGYGMCGIYADTPELALKAKEIFSSVGETLIVGNESDLDIVTGLAASGPAYVFMMIEALADGGVKMGLTRDEAQILAAHTVYGSAALLLASGAHPAEMKDMVASPGGTTIAGIHALETRGFRGAVIAAVEAGVQRAREKRNSDGGDTSK